MSSDKSGTKPLTRAAKSGIRWPVDMLLVSSSFAIPLMLVTLWHTPALAAWVGAAVAAWLLSRWTRSNRLGGALFFVAAGLFGMPLCVGFATGSLERMQAVGSGMFAGFILALAAMIVFLYRITRNPENSLSNYVGAALALWMAITSVIVNVMISRQLAAQGDRSETTQTLIAMHKLSAEIEAIRTRLGRLPKDEAELVQLRGAPMPLCGRKLPITYDNMAGEFRLSCIMGGFWGRHEDIFGWIFSFYGTDSAQRVHAVLF